MLHLDRMAYAGWDNCLRLHNGVVEAVVTLDVGPRIIRFGFINGQNLFHEFPDQVGRTGGVEWKNYGGHRLWHAPEVEPRTYFPDNAPVRHEWDGKILTVTPPEEASNRLQLAMDIEMDPVLPLVSLCHRIRNTGVWDVELAPWCLSVMAAGGRAVFPQEPYVPHGESYAPARPLVLWPFTHMDDPRWIWGRNYVQLRQDDAFPSKLKVGAANSPGWAAYLLGGDVFIKRFPFVHGASYPDMGCNCEFFTMPGFLEVETLGPLARIAPGSTVRHMERWFAGRLRTEFTDAALDANLLPLVKAFR